MDIDAKYIIDNTLKKKMINDMDKPLQDCFYVKIKQVVALKKAGLRTIGDLSKYLKQDTNVLELSEEDMDDLKTKFDKFLCLPFLDLQNKLLDEFNLLISDYTNYQYVVDYDYF